MSETKFINEDAPVCARRERISGGRYIIYYSFGKTPDATEPSVERATVFSGIPSQKNDKEKENV